jgi:hypothetical protein
MPRVTTPSSASVVLLSVLSGAVGGAGAALAVRHFVPEPSRAEQPAPARTAVTQPPQPPAASAELTTAPKASERAALETKAKLELVEARLARLDQLRERLETSGVLDALTTKPEDENRAGAAADDATTRRLREQFESTAATAGLKGERAKAFVDAAVDMTRRAEEMERLHAKKSVDGGVTTITIEGHAVDAERLRTEFETWVGRHLESAERETMAKTGEYGVLVYRLGSQPRTITVRTADGQVTLKDQARSAPGEPPSMAIEVSGPAAIKEMLLADYAHLLR